MNKKNTIIVKNYIFTTVYQMVSYIVPIVVTPYLSRIFGPSGVGIQSYVCAVTSYFTMFAMLGTSIYGAREIAQCRDNILICSTKFWEIHFLKVITTFVSAIIWCAFFLLTTRYSSFYLAAAVQIIATIFDVSWFFEGHEKMDVIAVRNIIVKLLNCIFVFSRIKSSNDLWIYILSIGVFTIVGNLSLWISIKRYLVHIDFRSINIRRHIKNTLVYFIPTFATFVYTVLDKVMIGVITKSETENGLYEQAERIVNIGKNLVCTLPNVISVRISYLFASGNEREIMEKFKISIEFYWLIGLPLTMGMIGISHSFVPWYFGNGFEQVEYLIYIMSWLVLVVGASAVLGRVYLTPSGQRARSSKAIVAGAVFNFILNLVLIPKFGAYGAAIATLAGEVLVTFMYLYMCMEFIRISDFYTSSIKKIIASVVMLGFIKSGFLNKLATSWKLTMIQIVIGAVAYFFVLYILKDKLTIRILKKIVMLRRIN